MKRRKLTALTIILLIINICSCKKIREELIPTRVEGTVTDAETGEAIPNSTVYLYRWFKGNETLLNTYTTNEKGEFKIKEKLRDYEYAGKDQVGYVFFLLAENKPLFYTETINNKNTPGIDKIYYNQYRDNDATAVLEITRKNNVSLKLRKTGLIRFVAIDNPNVIASPLIYILDNNWNRLTKNFNLSVFQDGEFKIYSLPGWYKVKRETMEIIDLEVKYKEGVVVEVEY